MIVEILMGIGFIGVLTYLFFNRYAQESYKGKST